MPEIGIFAIAIAGALVALLAPLEVAFGALAAAWLLVPQGLVLPGGFHLFFVDRIVLGAFVLRLLLRSGRPGEPAGRAYRLTPVHAAVLVFVTIGLFDGVVLAPGELHANADQWFRFIDMACVFVVTLAVLRTIGVWRVLRIVTGVIVVALGIGMVERITGSGWSHYLSEHVPLGYQTTAGAALLVRGGAVRAQVGSAFALELGWVLVMLLPLLTMAVLDWTARRRRQAGHRHLLLVVPLAMMAVVVFTASRSAEVGVVASAVLLVGLALAPRRLTVGVAAGGLVLALVLVAAPSLVGSPFTAAAHSNSIASRFQRLPDIFALTVHRPFAGIGYTGLAGSFGGADDGYALLYAQVGMLGLLSWLALLATCLATALRTVRAPRNSATRNLGVACAIGILAVVVAGASYDISDANQSTWALMVLAALSCVLAEQLPARQRAPRRWAWRAVWPVAGATAGALVLAAAPVAWSESFHVYVDTPYDLATYTAPPTPYLTSSLVNSVCGYLDQSQARRPGTAVRCTRPADVRAAWPSVADVRIGGDSRSAVTGEARLAFAAFRAMRYPTVVPVGLPGSGTPAWAVTAPLSGAVVGLTAALLVPPLRRRRTSPAP